MKFWVEYIKCGLELDNSIFHVKKVCRDIFAAVRYMFKNGITVGILIDLCCLIVTGDNKTCNVHVIVIQWFVRLYVEIIHEL